MVSEDECTHTSTSCSRWINHRSDGDYELMSLSHHTDWEQTLCCYSIEIFFFFFFGPLFLPSFPPRFGLHRAFRWSTFDKPPTMISPLLLFTTTQFIFHRFHTARALLQNIWRRNRCSPADVVRSVSDRISATLRGAHNHAHTHTRVCVIVCKKWFTAKTVFTFALA